MQNTIAPLAFHQALLSGAGGVINKREELNRINGFPVPDRDTGNNLAYMMQHLRQQLPPAASFDALLTKLTELSLMAARGSSGAIFSQYFSGFREALAQAKEGIAGALSLQGLFTMFAEGYASAYRSLQQPREGTILSAMYSFKEGFQQTLAKSLGLEDASRTALHFLQEAVEQSITILPEQRALRAPDAGAMAFYYFAEAFLLSLLGKAQREEPLAITIPDLPPEENLRSETESPAFRFCTEALVELSDNTEVSEQLKDSLMALGDSLVVSSAGRLARIHLHTNQPAQAIDLVESLGRLMEVKADDMGMQQALAQAHPGQIALVTDSIADVPEELLGPHVYVLPLHLMADGVSYQDKRSISFDRVRRLSGRLTSSQLNLAELRRFLDPITAAYEQVLILTVSSKMSGIHARCQEYLAQQPQADIRLVDSRVNSGAQGLLALHAARRLQQGAGLQEVADELEGLRERTKIYVSLPNLKAMVASGRLNRRIGKLLMATRFLPLVTINREGEGTITGISFSRKRSDRLLMNKLTKGRVQSYAVVHVNDEQRALAAARLIRGKIGMEPEYVCDISAIVANFSGESSYAVALIEKEKVT